MKKKYVKPNSEYIEFYAKEETLADYDLSLPGTKIEEGDQKPDNWT